MILGPALGGFVWLLHFSIAAETTADAAGRAQLGSGLFVVGTVSVLLLLLLGAVYSLALGYNYRYIILQLAKFEAMLRIRRYMLKGWPKCRDEFLGSYKLLCCIPWCTPPEVIKVFWWAFLGGIGGVALTACLYRPDELVLSVVISVATVAFLIGLLAAPLWFGMKLHKKCKQEPKFWVP